MESLSHEQIVVMFLSLGILLGVARLLGELAQKFHQPAVLGELLAGVILGKTVLGNLFPETNQWLFPDAGPNAVALTAISTLAVVLFLLVAGLEVDLSIVLKQGRLAPKVSFLGITFSFALGFTVASLFPFAMGRHAEADSLTFALFFATAMSISALPVIAKTLMDLDLYRSDLGMVIVSAAIVDDLVGWIIFAVVLGMIGGTAGHDNSILLTILLTLTFAATMLTVGRYLIHRSLPFLQKYTRWPGGVLGFALTLALLGAAFTEWIGIHAIFGSFLVGVAIGDSRHLREHTRVTIDHFVSFIFAPVFFASIGLRVDFLAHFDWRLVMTVLTIACSCKLIGDTLGALWGGLSRRESLAVGFAMNSRGAMEIILGILALEAGLISERLFVALVVMAIVTSMLSGPMIRLILKPAKKRLLEVAISPNTFLPKLQAQSRRDAIREMVASAAEIIDIDAETIERAVWKREETMSTGIGNGVAIPHARLKALTKSVVIVGISDPGIDFDAPDGMLAHIIFMLLTPHDDAGQQLELSAEIVHLFRDPHLVEEAIRTEIFSDFRDLLQKSFNAEQRAHSPGQNPA